MLNWVVGPVWPFGQVGNDRHTFGAKDNWCAEARLASLDDMTTAVLLADSESETRGRLERHLSSDGFLVIEAGWDAQALDLAERSRPDVVLAGEPELCRRLREGEPGRRWDRNVPVIVLASADADPVDRVRAFERGADDVVGRHLYPELVARIHALVRRSAFGPADVAEVGNLIVDHRARLVRIGGEVVRLSGREFDLVARLASDPRRVFTKEELLKDLWGYQSGRFVTRTVDSHASRLRRKLRDVTGDDRFIVNVWGRGYRLID